MVQIAVFAQICLFWVCTRSIKHKESGILTSYCSRVYIRSGFDTFYVPLARVQDELETDK